MFIVTFSTPITVLVDSFLLTYLFSLLFSYFDLILFIVLLIITLILCNFIFKIVILNIFFCLL